MPHFFRKAQDGKVRKRIAYQRNGKTHYRWQWVNAPKGSDAPIPGDDSDYRTHVAYAFSSGSKAYKEHVIGQTVDEAKKTRAEQLEEFHKQMQATNPVPEIKPDPAPKMSPKGHGPIYSLSPIGLHAVTRETALLAAKNPGKWIKPTADTMGYSVKLSGAMIHVKFMDKKPEAKFHSMPEAIAYIKEQTGPRALERVHEAQKKLTPPEPKQKFNIKVKEPTPEPKKSSTKRRKEVTTRVALRKIKPGSWGQVGGHDVYRTLSGTYELPGGVKADSLQNAVKHMVSQKVNKPSKEETAKSAPSSEIRVGSRVSFGQFGHVVTGKVTKIRRKGKQILVTIGGTEYSLMSHRKVKFLKSDRLSILQDSDRTPRLTRTPDGTIVNVWH